MKKEKLLTTSQQMPSQSRSNSTPANFLLPAFFAKRVTWYGVSLWSVWVRCLGYVPSQLCNTSLLTGRTSVKNRRNLDVVQALLSNNLISLC